MSLGALQSSDIFLESQRLQCQVLAQDRPEKALSAPLADLEVQYKKESQG